MSLRRKNIIAIVSTMVGLLLVLFVISQFIILRQSDEQQKAIVQSDVGRAVNALNQHLDGLTLISSDWANWDETYRFVQDANAQYIVDNLSNDSLINLRLDFMLFVNTQGEKVYLKLLNKSDEAKSDDQYGLKIQPDDMQAILKMTSSKQLNKGFIYVGSHPTLVVARPILNSAMSGSPHGMLVIGRYLTRSRLTQISQQTRLTVDIRRLDAPDLASDFLMAKSILTPATHAPIFYTQIEHNAEGYTLLPDINNQPLLIMQIQTQNDIYEAGQQSVWYILLILLVAGIVFGSVIVWLSERIVISRIAFLDRRIAEISTSNDLSARIMMHGDDELARLTATINDSLAKREQSQEEQFRTLNTELTRLNGELEAKVADLNANRKYKDRFFSHASHELRTPLAIMRTRLYLARKKPEQWENHIDRLDETMGRLLNVIDDVFDMTKLQDQSLVISPQYTDLKEFIELVLEGKSGRLAEKQLRINKQFTDMILPVNLDPTLFDRACDKLIECAIDYCEPESEITIRLYDWSSEDKVSARMEIACQAFQFPPDEIEEMFSPFYQVSEGKKYTSGLNLAIAKQIMVIHGGSLIALNNEQTGGCFQATLPLFTAH